MAIIPTHVIDEIMQTARIEEVIGEFVQLKRSGSNYKGLSPFVDEKTASFMVSPAKQIFKCFSSGKGGTVVSFLMEKEHYSYPEALRWLASKYNIEVPEEKPQTAEELAAVTEKESLYIINDFARDYFSEQMMNSEEGKAIGLSYFEERGFRPETIKLFELGYCPNKGDYFTKAALQKGYKSEYLQTVGLVKQKDDRQFDFFRGRVMFPIHSTSGRVLGFGGRTLQSDKKIAKYFNSHESPIYHKSDILYGLFYAKSDMIKYDNCYLCEGYTDVISLYQSGLKNVVASSGTSLTREQIKLIRRFTQNITILYDGDAAGIKASFRGIDLILEEGLTVKVVLFPDGEDPDSYAKGHTSEELSEYVTEHSQDFVTFKTEILLADAKNDPIQKAKLITDVVRSVGLIPDAITRSVYVKEVAKLFDIDEQIVASEIAKSRGQKQEQEFKRAGIEKKQAPREEEYEEPPIMIDGQIIERPKPVPNANDPSKLNTHDYCEYSLMRVLVKYGVLAVETKQRTTEGAEETIETSVAELICHELDKDELIFNHPLYQKLHQQILDGLENKTLFQPSYFLRQEDRTIVEFVSNIEADPHEISPNWMAQHKILTLGEKEKLVLLVMESIYSFKQVKIIERINEIRVKLAALTGDQMSEMADLLSEQIFLEKVKATIAQKLNRIIT
jgi:DNA primase